MQSTNDKRERVRQYGIIAYLVMLTLIVPLTVFAARQESNVYTQASSGEKTTDITPSVTPGVK